MIICGIDPSINSSGLVKFYLDDKFEITKKIFLGFSSVKKNIKKFDDGEIKFYSKKQFKFDIEKFLWMEKNINEFIHDCDYIAIEDYSFASKGKVFNMAECIGYIKRCIFLNDIPLRKYDISSIKMFATENGLADKKMMIDAYLKLEDIFHFQENKIVKSPYNDIVDAYFVGRLLQLELKLRYGFIQLKELRPKTIEIFNRVTKAYPINILCREFILNNIK